MKSLRFLLAALLASTLLVSCPSGSGHIDSRTPTVTQQDAYDVNWGLAPRKARGNPKMRYQYNPKAEQAAAPMNIEPEASVAPAPGRAAPSAPTIPATLR